jgi:hypothetical protein
VTQALVPSGVIATSSGPLPTVMVAVTVFVAVSCPSGEVHLQSGRWVWDHVRGTVLIAARDLARAIAPRSPGAEMNEERDKRGRGAHPRPAFVWGVDELGVRAGQPVPGVPAWRNSCQRSGSNSSIRFAGWVLIRSSTSRR